MQRFISCSCPNSSVFFLSRKTLPVQSFLAAPILSHLSEVCPNERKNIYIPPGSSFTPCEVCLPSSSIKQKINPLSHLPLLGHKSPPRSSHCFSCQAFNPFSVQVWHSSKVFFLCRKCYVFPLCLAAPTHLYVLV